MKEGYLQLQRKFFDHWLWSEQRTFSKAEAFLDLLQIAAFAPTKRIVREKLIPIGQGELIASTRFLATRWGWGKDKVAKFLDMLECDHMTRRETRQGETVIILSNYGKYTSAPNSQPDTGTDRGQTVTRQRPDKLEEGKEGKEPSAETPAIAWSSADGWSGITAKDKEEWAKAYPACDLDRQMESMSQWLKSNPSKAKKKLWRKFLTNWLSRSQERGGDMNSKKSTSAAHTKRTNYGL